ncbi:lycopene cyclase family protein [Streptomyces albipurpureus]|uniref:Lycopene cyclase family protein n=1 Tax=Streptomyces albipurpureus TaxID=2897419 RepID=A0ABT0UXP0_9ACTN|nr:lycopene cyclase family protein [Streptomyces sp. CWNU-1]MCM2391931.1 lycopene cyclase family protein [Streptomyces sp. CWNU-1]
MLSQDVIAADVVIVGAGAAGLSLAHALTAPGAGHRPSIVLVEAPDGPLRPPDRTWCFWEEGDGEFEEAVLASWRRLRIHGRDGERIERTLHSLRYKMIPSPRFAEVVGDRLRDTPRVRQVRAVAQEVRSVPEGAEVRCTTQDGRLLTVRGRCLYDSRPPAPPPPARTTLLQHFRGWFVHADEPAFDPSTVELMDFRVPQPRHGLAFGYVLPLGPRDALVEYTEFSRAPLSRQAYESALELYTQEVLKLGPIVVRGAEEGVIPMTDARFRRREGPALFRIGAAGGATRPATGYTFSAVQRQTRRIAATLRAGGSPTAPAPHPRRALAMDAVLLRALDTGRVAGPEFFTELFRRTPPDRMLRFLDGRTRLLEDIRIGFATPVGPMLRTALELPLLRRAAVSGGRTDRAVDHPGSTHREERHR